MAIITNTIKKRFVRDWNLPINIFETKIFLYFIDLYDDMFDTRKKYRLLVETVEHFGNSEAAFIGAFNELKDKIIHDISNKESFNDFRNSVYTTRFHYISKYLISNQNIYNENFDGKIIGSIDLVKANFNSLKCWNEDIVFGAKDYNKFISHYTDVEYFKQSKQLRQIIFGNLCPKKQQTIQKSILAEIADELIDETNLFETIHENKSEDYLPFELVKAGSDELLVLGIPDDLQKDSLLKFSECIIKSIPEKYKNFIKIDFFRLGQIHPKKPFFVKESLLDNKKVEFKNIPSTFFPQVFKQYYNFELCDYDLLFQNNILNLLR